MTKLQKLGYLILLSTTAIYADTIGGEVSLGFYSHTPSGYASYESTVSVDLEDDLKWSQEQDVILKAYIEHPFPFLPNLKVGYTNLSHDGQGTVTAFSWGGIINVDGDIDSSLDLKMYDVTSYYELLDNTIEIDTGITLRYLDGNIDVTVTPVLSFLEEHEVVNFTSLVPMFYGKFRANIPATDISLQAEGNFITYEDTTFYDYEISARYTFTMGLGIEAGYKAVHLDSEDLEEGLSTDIDFKGPYASIIWDF
jgi:outer membrane protein